MSKPNSSFNWSSSGGNGPLPHKLPDYPADEKDVVIGEFMMKIADLCHVHPFCPEKRCRRTSRCHGNFNTPGVSDIQKLRMCCGVPLCIAPVWEEIQPMMFKLIQKL